MPVAHANRTTERRFRSQLASAVSGAPVISLIRLPVRANRQRGRRLKLQS